MFPQTVANLLINSPLHVASETAESWLSDAVDSSKSELRGGVVDIAKPKLSEVVDTVESTLGDVVDNAKLNFHQTESRPSDVIEDTPESIYMRLKALIFFKGTIKPNPCKGEL